MTTTAPTRTPQTRPQRPDVDDGDHDRFSHYVAKHELTRALVEGTAVTALCGKRWVPSRDPERYPVCPTCREIRAELSD